jgi:integrase
MAEQPPAPRRGPGRPSESYPEEQRALRLADWPAPDRAAWEAAIARGEDDLDEAGAAAHLRRATRRNRIQAWGQFLNALRRWGDLDPAAPPESRPTPERIGRWIGELRERGQRPSTTHRLLLELSLTVADMAPSGDWAWIRRHPRAPTPQEIRAGRKPIAPFDAGALLLAAEQRLAALEAGPRQVATARAWRDIAIVVLAVHTGLRVTNLGDLVVGRHLERLDGVWRLSLEAQETKTGRPFSVLLSERIGGLLDRWMDHWRPVLLGGREDHGALWLNAGGRATQAKALPLVFARVGEELLGRKVNPHLVRHVMATGLLRDDPTAVRRAAAGLGHANTRSVSEVYDRSGSAGAQQLWRTTLRRAARGQGWAGP